MSPSSRKIAAGGFLGLLLGAATGWLLLQWQLRHRGLPADQSELASVAVGAVLGGGAGGLLAPWSLHRTANRWATPYGMVLTVLFFLFWLFPMAATGALSTSLYTYPAPIRNQFRISCLFTSSSKSWPTVHYEVRKYGRVGWEEGPLEGFFDIDIFGYRSRLNRIVLVSRHKNKKGRLHYKNRLRLQEIADFIAARWLELNPDDPPVLSVRYTIVNHPVGGEHCMAREAWSRPPLSGIPEKLKRHVATLETGQR